MVLRLLLRALANQQLRAVLALLAVPRAHLRGGDAGLGGVNEVVAERVVQLPRIGRRLIHEACVYVLLVAGAVGGVVSGGSDSRLLELRQLAEVRAVTLRVGQLAFTFY